jgi:hypothetical protein
MIPACGHMLTAGAEGKAAPAVIEQPAAHAAASRRAA